MNLSSHRHLDVICLIITLVTLGVTVIFMLGEHFGLTRIVSDKTADRDRLFSTRDYDASWSDKNAIHIDLNHLDQLPATSAYLLDGDLYLARGGTYVLQGELADRQIIVDANANKIQLVLDGVTLTHHTLAPVVVRSADKVFLTLPDDADNHIIAYNLITPEASASGADAAIYSKSDLTLNGAGRIDVTAVNGHGIKSTDDLVVTGGAITVNASHSALLGKDSVRIADGNFNLTGSDGIKANRTDRLDKGYVTIAGGYFDLRVAQDGIQAETDLHISGGHFDITTGGGSSQAPIRQEEFGFGGGMGGPPTGDFDEFLDKLSSRLPPLTFDGAELPADLGVPPDRAMRQPTSDTTDTVADTTSRKCLKSGRHFTISGGYFQLDCYDDALHSNGDLSLSGGELTLSSGDDTLHADQTVTLDGADLTVLTSYEGIEGQNIYVLSGHYDVTSQDDGFNASDGSGTEFFGFTGPDFGPQSRGRQATPSDTLALNRQPPDANTVPPASATPEVDLPILRISGGTVRVHAAGDGLDSNGHLLITGGDIIVDGPSNNGNSALDSGSESGGELTISGGTILALGAAGMAETFSANSTQPSMLVVFNQNFTAGEQLRITDSSGQQLMTYTIAKNGNALVYSSPQLQLGQTYTASVGVQNQTIIQDTVSTTVGNTGARGGGFGGIPENFSPDARQSRNFNQTNNVPTAQTP